MAESKRGRFVMGERVMDDIAVVPTFALPCGEVGFRGAMVQCGVVFAHRVGTAGWCRRPWKYTKGVDDCICGQKKATQAELVIGCLYNCIRV